MGLTAIGPNARPQSSTGARFRRRTEADTDRTGSVTGAKCDELDVVDGERSEIAQHVSACACVTMARLSESSPRERIGH